MNFDFEISRVGSLEISNTRHLALHVKTEGQFLHRPHSCKHKVSWSLSGEKALSFFILLPF